MPIIDFPEHTSMKERARQFFAYSRAPFRARSSDRASKPSYIAKESTVASARSNQDLSRDTISSDSTRLMAKDAVDPLQSIGTTKPLIQTTITSSSLLSYLPKLIASDQKKVSPMRPFFSSGALAIAGDIFAGISAKHHSAVLQALELKMMGTVVHPLDGQQKISPLNLVAE